MESRSDLIKLDDEDIYLILYLRKVKGHELRELAQRFKISVESLNDLLAGKVRKDCCKSFRQIEKYLAETF